MEDGRMRKQVTLITILVLLLIPKVVNAAWYCDYSTLARLKAYASNINTSYDYVMENNTPKFTITITNVYKTMILYDNTNKKYYYPDGNKDLSDFTLSGYDNGKSYKFTIYTNESKCTENIIYSFYVTLPTFNPYYNDPLCANYQDYKLCQKWSNTGLTYENFQKEMTSYITVYGNDNKSSDTKTTIPTWLQFYLKYYLLILPGVIVICFGIMYSYYKNDDFDF